MNDPKKGDFFMRKRMKPCGCPRPNCGCNVKEIVYPVKENVVECFSEETVKHVHPSHTTVVNHHLVKNEHVYPHSTSYENTYNEIDVQGAPGPGGQVGGAMSPGMGMPGQVGGAMKPGKPHHGPKPCGPMGGMGHCNKPHHKW